MLFLGEDIDAIKKNTYFFLHSCKEDCLETNAEKIK